MDGPWSNAACVIILGLEWSSDQSLSSWQGSSLDYFIVVFDFFLLIVYCGVCKLSSEDTDSNATPSSVDIFLLPTDYITKALSEPFDSQYLVSQEIASII